MTLRFIFEGGVCGLVTAETFASACAPGCLGIVVGDDPGGAGVGPTEGA